MPAAVAMGLAKMCSHWEKTRLGVMPSDLRSWRSAMSRRSKLSSLRSRRCRSRSRLAASSSPASAGAGSAPVGQAAARGLHPVRAWMTQRQRLEVPVHAFPTSLQRKAGRGLAGCPGPYPYWKRSWELHPQAEDPSPTSKSSGHSKRSPPCPQESQTRRAAHERPSRSAGTST